MLGKYEDLVLILFRLGIESDFSQSSQRAQSFFRKTNSQIILYDIRCAMSFIAINYYNRGRIELGGVQFLVKTNHLSNGEIYENSKILCSSLGLNHFRR